MLHPDERGRVGAVAELILDADGVEKLDRYVVRFQEHAKRFWSTELKPAKEALVDQAVIGR